MIGEDLGHSVDPRAWTKSHPWASLATAAAGGFALVMLFPSEEKRALRRLEKIQRAVAPKLRIDREDLVREIRKTGSDGEDHSGNVRHSTSDNP